MIKNNGMLRIFSRIIRYLWRKLALLLPINKKKVVFQNVRGAAFGCNPKAIAVALHKLDPTIKCVWLANKHSSDAPHWLKEVFGYFRWVFEMSTAKVWVDNVRGGFQTNKRSGQFYIQTWHGSIALKQVEKDAEDKLPKSYIDIAKRDSLIADLFISNSTWCTNLYRRAFWYNGPILEVGSPRCDILINNPHGTGKVHEYYKIGKEIPLAIYAPTFRKNGEDAYDVDCNRLLSALRKRFHPQMKLLIRMHPNLSFENFDFVYDEDFINGSLYPDMYELLAECDIEINDYSSTMFEMALMKKPVFLYASDIEAYKSDRDFYFDIHSLPFPLAENNDDLERNILFFDENQYNINLETFMSALDIKETGHASEDVAQVILGHIYKTK